MRAFRSSRLVILPVLLLALALAACSSGGSNEEPDPPPDTTPPGVPVGLSAASGEGEVTLEWNAVSAADLDGYNVYRATSSISSVEGQTPVNGSARLTATTFTDADVTNGTTYFYRITAVDESGNESDGSDEVEVTPFPPPPDRP